MFVEDYITSKELELYKKALDDSDSILLPYFDRWANYNSVINADVNERQKESFINSMLYNGNNSIKFLYDDAISTYNELIEESVKKIKTEDHAISLCNEVYFTSKIEGAHTTIARTMEIHNGSPINPDNEESERMVKNCFDATKFLNLHPNGKINEQILLNVWNLITNGVCQNEDIKGSKYRIGDIQVGFYEGPSFNHVEDLMKKWLIFYNSKKYDNYPFIKAALLHYSFETIHPFCDGNGRTGRMLMNHYLITHGYEQIKGVSFSHTIDKNRVMYDASFSMAENEWNDCTPFLEYMCSVYYNTFKEIERTMESDKESDKVDI